MLLREREPCAGIFLIVQGSVKIGSIAKFEFVRWHLRYPLAYEQVAELIQERGVAVNGQLASGAGFRPMDRN
jgi:hypothetical protein